MAQHCEGIQVLLAAEKKALEKVAEAKKRKAKRLKDARVSAQAEIEKFKEEREKQFKEYEAAHMGSREEIVGSIEGGTVTKLAAIETSVQQQKKGVIEKLLKIVYDVEPKVHCNFRPGAP
ncbi:V-type proton ATPase subunit G-like [Ornithodoros turicata]|uniref:V-type proton ATPase subunit G-like n=1 Tax=Ornithodoros turicata TaxID=34597 RepID=UPI003138FAE3